MNVCFIKKIRICSYNFYSATTKSSLREGRKNWCWGWQLLWQFRLWWTWPSWSANVPEKQFYLRDVVWSGGCRPFVPTPTPVQPFLVHPATRKPRLPASHLLRLNLHRSLPSFGRRSGPQLHLRHRESSLTGPRAFLRQVIRTKTNVPIIFISEQFGCVGTI